MAKPRAVLDAPSNLGLAPPAPGREPGTRRMPDVLRWNGFRARLGARDAGRVEAPAYGTAIHPCGIRNGEAILRYSRTLADTVERIIQREELAVVVGGDCSILLGNLLGARRQVERLGLVFIDGHSDFNTPERSQTSGAAGMDLALAVGVGPPLLSALAADGPLVDSASVVHLGLREEDPAFRASGIAALDLADIERAGPAETAARVLERLDPLPGFWVHVDADVLNDDIMPAVDSRAPGGLSYEALVALIRPLLASPRALGVELTIYDPDLDPAGTLGRALTAALVEAIHP
ncbi:MAG TPA: arginase family protein [Myxococcaceae bacterium]|nr:arginase family protein [Myxococcaceae bacterium]